MNRKPFLSLKQFFLILLVIVIHSILPSNVYAQETAKWQGVCVSGANNDVATIQGLECLITNVFTVIITLIGLTAFVMLIVGSVTWLTSGGNTEKTKKARDTMTHAVIGVVIALSAFIVLNLIAGFTGIEEIKNFKIPTSEIETINE